MEALREDALILELTVALGIAHEHLKQYRVYSEEMRKIGRGCSISHQFSPEYADKIISDALEKAQI